MGAGLPSAGIVAGSLQPEQMALKLAAGMRTSTLKGRLSEHRRMARWLLPVFGHSFPMEPVELLDYLLERSSEPCGPSVPSSVLSMVAFFERVGGVPSASRVSGHGLVQALVDDLKLSLRSELPSPTRKAPQYFTCMIVCWELVVVNTGELTYTRLVAWCKLVKVWAAMRTSDTDCCPPSKMVWRGSGLSGQIDMSKTTGTGKRVGAIHFHVSTGAWICQESWLRTGWLLFEPTRGTRKCLLPLPSKGALTLSEKAPSYTQSCAASQKLTSDCKVLVEGGVERRAVAGDQPLFFLGDQKVLVEGGVERRVVAGDQPVFFLGVQSFWSGHSDRPTLASWAATLGHPKEHIDAVGRWSPAGSDEYIRTSKAIILQLQGAVARSIREAGGEDILGEDFLLQELEAFLLQRGMGPALVEGQLKALRCWREIARGGEEEEDRQSNDGEVALAGVPAVELPEASSLPDGTWIVSVGKNGRSMTLHLLGNCWRRPGIHFKLYTILPGDAAGDRLQPTGDYSKVCRDCFPQTGKGKVSSGSEGSSSSTSDSSESEA
ncbi:unnamed protein product [Polarella glacialis]|uniref:Uncharacterized protein n=1 Tax=Polarella glacialis TaxID=89957 RepID=A0A813EF06_POLGL|nr:unnamed protein product [Polarella glacialis]